MWRLCCPYLFLKFPSFGASMEVEGRDRSGCASGL